MQCQRYLGMCQGTQELGVRIIILCYLSVIQQEIERDLYGHKNKQTVNLMSMLNRELLNGFKLVSKEKNLKSYNSIKAESK